MKLVNRLVELTSGDVRIDGQSVNSLDETELRRGIGYVIQQVGLFPHMTVAENVATVPKLLGWSKAEIAERVDELLDLVDLPAQGLPLPLRLADLRRRAPARRPRARARGRPAGDADGRAVRRARPDHAHAAAEGAAADPGRGAEDDHLRHARHRRGDPDRQPDRDPARGRRPRPVRHARRDPRSPRRRLRRALRRAGPRPQASVAETAGGRRARARERRRQAGRGREHDAPRRALADAERGLARSCSSSARTRSRAASSRSTG